MKKILFVFLLAVAVALSYGAFRPKNPAKTNKELVLEATKEFYDWYAVPQRASNPKLEADLAMFEKLEYQKRLRIDSDTCLERKYSEAECEKFVRKFMADPLCGFERTPESIHGFEDPEIVGNEAKTRLWNDASRDFMSSVPIHLEKVGGKWKIVNFICA